MKKNILAITLLLTLVAAVAAAQPFAPNAAPGPRAAMVLGRFLELTPDQVAAWKQIHQDTAATIKPLAEKQAGLRKDLQTALQAATPDPTAVGKISIALHDVGEQIRTAREASQSKLRDTLTADQKVKYDAFEAAMKALRPRPGPRG
jgi:Spy/CpxP family protein refolding chaperone